MSSINRGVRPSPWTCDAVQSYIELTEPLTNWAASVALVDPLPVNFSVTLPLIPNLSLAAIYTLKNLSFLVYGYSTSKASTGQVLESQSLFWRRNPHPKFRLPASHLQ